MAFKKLVQVFVEGNYLFYTCAKLSLLNQGGRNKFQLMKKF